MYVWKGIRIAKSAKGWILDRHIAHIEIALSLCYFLSDLKNLKCSEFCTIFFFQRYQEHCSVYKIKRAAAVYYQGTQYICIIYINIHLQKKLLSRHFWSDFRNLNCFRFCEISSFQRYQEHCYLFRNKRSATVYSFLYIHKLFTIIRKLVRPLCKKRIDRLFMKKLHYYGVFFILYTMLLVLSRIV
jgi:hypothetical protein